MLPSALEMLNLFGFAVGSMSLTVAIFYGFFVNLHNRNLDQSNKLANAINTLYAELQAQRESLLQFKTTLSETQTDLAQVQTEITQVLVQVDNLLKPVVVDGW